MDSKQEMNRQRINTCKYLKTNPTPVSLHQFCRYYLPAPALAISNTRNSISGVLVVISQGELGWPPDDKREKLLETVIRKIKTDAKKTVQCWRSYKTFHNPKKGVFLLHLIFNPKMYFQHRFYIDWKNHPQFYPFLHETFLQVIYS